MHLKFMKCDIAGIEMDGPQRRKAQNIEKPFPGCLGRMVNLFDVSTGVAGNRLLMDKPHHDGESCLLMFYYKFFRSLKSEHSFLPSRVKAFVARLLVCD